MSSDIAKLIVELELEKDRYQRGLRGVEDDTDRAGRRMDSFFARSAAAAAGFLGAEVVQAAAKAAAAGVSMGMDYEQAFNTMQAVSHATDAQMKEVGRTAKALGADLTLPATSAGDAAAAMVELAKGGLSVEESMAAAKGTLQLAAAAQMAEAEAATLTAQALNAFKLQGKDATRVADLLAAASNASAAEIKDVGSALQQSAAVFAAAHVPIEDLTTAIGQMANAGIIGSDAGTSLKSMMLALETPTNKARNTMKDLGLQIYDAQGKMVPFRDIIGQLEGSTKKLTQAQRDQALGVIFGSDGIRAANVLIAQGVAGYDAMHVAVTQQGAAAEVAEAKTKGLRGAISGLQSVIETGLLTVYEKVAPFAERFVRGLAEDLPKAIPAAQAAIKGIADAFQGGLSGDGLQMAAGLTGGAAGGPVGAMLARWAAGAAEQIPAIKSAVASATKEVKGGLKAFASAFKSGDGDVTSGGFAGLMERAGFTARRASDVGRDVATAAAEAFRLTWAGEDWESHNPVESLAVGAAKSVRKVQEVSRDLGKWIGDAVDDIAGFLRNNQKTWDQWWVKVKDIATQVGGALSSAWVLIKGVFTQGVAIVSDLWDRFGDHLWDHIKVHIDAVLQVLGGAFEIIKGILNVFAAIFTGDWKRLWDGIKQILGGVWDVIVGIVRVAINLVSTVIGAEMAIISAAWSFAWHAIATLFTDIWAGIKAAFGAVFSWIGDRINEMVGWVQAVPGRLASFVGTMWDGIRDAFGNVFGWIGARITEMVGWIRDIPGRLGGFVGGIFDGLTNAAKYAFNLVASFWNNTVGRLSFRAPDWVPFIGGMGWDVPDIPLLAKGGTAVSGGLAIVGDAGPELLDMRPGATVRPLSGGGGGGFGMDERLLAKEIARELASALGAGRPFIVTLDGREVGRGVASWVREDSSRFANVNG